MDLRKEVDKLLGKLGDSLGLADLALDENNHCILLFDDKVILNLELDEEKEILVVYSYIGEVPFEGRENIFESFLESNFFWKNTQGATLGIDKHTQTVVLAYPMELPLKNKDIFEERLAVFVDVTEQWIDRLERMSQEAETLANEER
jgi:hypothetical protein